MRSLPVLSKPFALTIALLWVVLGVDSSRVPYFPYWIWPLMFGLIAAGVAHTTFRPDRWKLRLITAMTCAVGLIRGVALAIDQGRPGPAAGWLLIAMLSAAYYLARRDWLPERYKDEDFTS